MKRGIILYREEEDKLDEVLTIKNKLKIPKKLFDMLFDYIILN